MPYSANALCAIAEWVTNSPFHHLIQKRQIKYINNFLLNWSGDGSKEDATDVKMILEGNYIDAHYLDEYSHYFSKCFNKYPRDCSRVHFFCKSKLTHDSFKRILESNEPPESKAAKLGDYLGYLVIRPLPETFIAKVCLKPYDQEINNKLGVIRSTIKKRYSVSLFGIPLSVETVAFQEQDHVLSACATSSLWSFFHAHKCISLNNVPSAFEITRSAFPVVPELESPFPSNGLSAEMICRSIRESRLEARPIKVCGNEMVEKSQSCIELDLNYLYFQEEVYAYLAADFPIIMGVNLNGKGFHAVTILGYGYCDGGNADAKSIKGGADPIGADISSWNSLNSKAHKISRLYVHDDRTGPFTRLLLSDKHWLLYLDRNSPSPEPEVYTPENLILGVHPKIRIHYPKIRMSCVQLRRRIIIELLRQRDIYAKLQNSKLTLALTLAIEAMDSIEWDIRIYESSRFKETFQQEYSRNSIEKISILSMNMPKYIWSAKARHKGKIAFQLIFDSTDIPQGDVFMSMAVYDVAFLEIFDLFARACSRIRGEWNGTSVDPIGGIIKKLSQQESHFEELNRKFGDPKFPMYIKSDELVEHIIVQQGQKITGRNQYELTKLKSSQIYIWAINYHGELVIGIDTNKPKDKKSGHPTLLNGGPGRIAGEIKYNSRQKTWEVNSSSGRYTKGYYTAKEINNYLKNVISLRFEIYFPDMKFAIGTEKKLVKA